MYRYRAHRIGLTLIAIGFCLSSLSGLAGKGPQLSFAEDRKDFGSVKQGKILTHVFKFSNQGDEPLKINRVRSTCGCTAALLSKRELKPGERGEVKVTFNTSGYGGRLTKYIIIESNDAQQKQRQLAVSAAIDVPPRPQIELDWYSKDMGLLLESEPVESSVGIRNIGERELEVSFSHRSAKFSLPNGRPVSELKIPSGGEKQVRMAITPRKNSGLLREYVLLKTNDPQRPNMSLYVSGYIVTKGQLKELFTRYKDIVK